MPKFDYFALKQQQEELTRVAFQDIKRLPTASPILIHDD